MRKDYKEYTQFNVEAIKEQIDSKSGASSLLFKHHRTTFHRHDRLNRENRGVHLYKPGNE